MTKVVAHICTYNGEGVLPGFLKLYDRLDPAPDHTIFVTNNNRDRTLEILQEWGGEKTIISLWFVSDLIARCKSEYAGLAIARQLVWDLVRSKFSDYDVAWQLDDDSYIENYYALETFLDWLDNDSVDVIGGTYLRDFPDGRFITGIWLKPNGSILKFPQPFLPLMEPTCIGGGCMLLKRKVFMDPRVYVYPLLGTAAEDFGFCLRMRDAGYNLFLDGTVSIGHQMDRSRQDKAWTKREDMLDFVYG